MDRDELAAWLRLIETPRVGGESARRLLAALGSPISVFAASHAARSTVVGGSVASALAGEPSDTLTALCTKTLAWLDASARHAIVPLGDPRYPTRLLETADPPLLLYAQGDLALLGAESIAVVGSRSPTPQGINNALAFSKVLSEAGLTIVSGLALGIDAAAHEGGLDGQARTIAVVGTGLDQVYPRANQKLAARIEQHGLIISEFSLGTPPLGANFPRRNRIIAGLSLGTLVVEAALQSGSLITARLALECGREVFAIPGSIHAPQSRGCHALIKQGAKLVDSAQDVLQELPAYNRATGARPSSAESAGPATNGDTGQPPSDPLLGAMGFDPVSLDALVARTGWPAASLNARLLELELDGQVARLPGQLFQRLSHA